MIRLKTYKWLIFVGVMIIFADTSFGQRKPTRRPANNRQNNNVLKVLMQLIQLKSLSTTTQPSAYSNVGTSKTAIDTTLPVQVIQSSGNGLLDTSAKMSLRNDAGVEQNLIRIKHRYLMNPFVKMMRCFV